MHTYRLALPLLAALPLAPAATAQDLAPVTPHIVVETVGPDGWRARLGPTNLGVLLASEEGRALWRPYSEQLLGMWRMMVGEEEAFAAARDRVLAYGGAMRVAARVDDDGVTGAMVMLHGDGETDMKALAADLTQLIERSVPGEWSEADVGGRALSVRRDGDTAIARPFVERDVVFVAIGEHDGMAVPMGVGQAMTRRPLTLGEPKPDTPALRVTFDVDALVELEAGARGEQFEIMKALGFTDIDEVAVSVAAAGPHVMVDASVRMKAAPHGLVGAFAPVTQGVSALHALLPENTGAWKIGRFDCAALFRGVFDALVADEGQDRAADIRAEMKEELGIELDADLLAHMTDELLVVGSPFQDFDRADEATWMIAWRLADDAAFAAAFDKLTPNAKPFLSPAETVDVDGVALRRFGNFVGYDIWMAAGHGLFVVAAGRDAEEDAATLLRKAKAATFARGEDEAGPWHAGVARRYMPPGCNGLARGDLDSVLRVPAEWWTGPLDMLAPLGGGPAVDPEQAQEQQERFRAMLEQNGLSVVRTATGYADQRWTWRLYW